MEEKNDSRKNLFNDWCKKKGHCNCDKCYEKFNVEDTFEVLERDENGQNEYDKYLILNIDKNFLDELNQKFDDLTKKNNEKTIIEIETKAISYNSGYRIFRNKFVLSKKGKDYIKFIGDSMAGKKIILGNVKMMIEFHFKDSRIRDLDNLTKLLIDGLKNKIIEDDSKIFELITKKFIKSEKNKIIITIEKI